MHRAQLDIHLLDLWLFGSGRGEGAHIDSTPLLDARGLPYVPGRAVKGLLRDATRDWLLLQLPSEAQADSQLQELFGTRTSVGQTRHNTQAGRIQFTDAQLAPAVASVFASNPHQRKGLFHDLRATAIDDTVGTARPHTLRSIRAAVPMQLLAELSSSNSQDFDLLGKAVHLVTSLGAHRSRGLGRCTCSIQALPPTSVAA